MKRISLTLFLLLSESQALKPQISAYSEWDEIPGLSDMAVKGDVEMLQLDASM